MKTSFPTLSDSRRLQLLELPDGVLDFVLDTDTFNEIDDQFALVYALLCPERLRLQAVCAAPFFNENSTGPKDGMEKSYDEILRILSRMDVSPDGLVFKGSDRYLPDEDTPVDSSAARRIAELALAHTPDHPLYVAAIGAITNVASALLLEPSIIDRMVVIWLGGHAPFWPDTREFNLVQDIPAARVIFGSGVPLIQLPCFGVVDRLSVSLPEIEAWVRGRGAIGDYLADTYKACAKDHFAHSRVIWDLSAVAVLTCPDAVSTTLCHSPVVSDEGLYSFPADRHLIRQAYSLNRDAIFRALFEKLQEVRT